MTGRDEAAGRALCGFGEEGALQEPVSHLAWTCVVGRSKEWLGKAIAGYQWSEYLPTRLGSFLSPSVPLCPTACPASLSASPLALGLCTSQQTQQWQVVSPPKHPAPAVPCEGRTSPSLRSMGRCRRTEPVVVPVHASTAFHLWLLSRRGPPINLPLPVSFPPPLVLKLPHDNVLTLTHSNSYSACLGFLLKKQNHFHTHEG